MNVYLGKAETEFVQGKPKGYVRDLVRREMAAGKTLMEVIEELDEPDVRDVHAWQPPEVRPPGLRKR